MTLDQVVALAVSGESETLEFKATTGTRRKAAATVCAMLNQRGGHVVFGVTPAFPTIERVRAENGRDVLVVSVSPWGRDDPARHLGSPQGCPR